MAKDGLIENIQDYLDDKREAGTLKQVDRADRNLLKVFKDVEATKDVGLTLKAFKIILRDAEKHHINNQEIDRSIANALRELAGAETTLPKVYSARDYACVAEEHQTKKRTVQDRPKDQTRDFLTSHIARLRNECKVVSSDARVGLLNTQLSCLRGAEKEYIRLQDRAMGKEAEPTKERNRGLER